MDIFKVNIWIKLKEKIIIKGIKVLMMKGIKLRTWINH